MDVIIVSKTRMSSAACIGGVFADGRFVRLLDINGRNQSIDTDFKIGDVYVINFLERQNNQAPHLEDILLTSYQYKFSFPSIQLMVEYLTNKLNIEIWQGGTDALFDGDLQWTTSGSGYISAQTGIPNQSTGFWIPDKDLVRRDFREKVRYSYQSNFNKLADNDDILDLVSTPNIKNITFVGFQDPLNCISKGTLVRVSLARWWTHDNEKKCFLQLSGWYKE